MFAIEIDFKDQNSDAEIIYVKRPLAIVGAGPTAHVEVQDMRELSFQIQLVRDLGRRFRCKPLPLSEGVQVPSLLEGVYENEASLDLGPVSLHVTALDADLLLKETEAPDRAGVRVLRQACAGQGPLFPAAVVLGPNPVVISFAPDNPLFIGRGKSCALRLDSPEVSERHARLGYESGEFWIEDLGSTNGTFVNRNQISGRVAVQAGTPIKVGPNISIIGATSEDQIQRAVRMGSERPKKAPAEERKYPVLISVSEVARPARLVMPIDATLNVGRDPSSDIWLGAPHVSRKHCSLMLGKSGVVTVSDHSTNGTAYDDGVLRRGDLLELRDQPRVMDFGGGVTLAVCFNEEQERAFAASGGSPNVFKPAEVGMVSSAVQAERSVASGRRRQPEIEARPSPNSWRARVDRMFFLYVGMTKRGKTIFIFTSISLVIVILFIFNLIARLNF